MLLANINTAFIKNGLRFIKARIMSEYNVREMAQYSPFGIDSAPIDNALAATTPTGARGADIVVGYQNANQIAQQGETILYSSDPEGNYKATATLRTDGTIEILGTGDYFVRFNALNTALQSYFTSLNTAISAGVSSAGGAYTPPSTPDLTSAKINEIKTTS